MDKQRSRIQRPLGTDQASFQIRLCCFYSAAEDIFRRCYPELTGSYSDNCGCRYKEQLLMPTLGLS